MFEIPNLLKSYLDTKRNAPFGDFVNQSTYYSQLSYPWINYLNFVVRKCIAYGSGVSDLGLNPTLSASTGKAIVDGATRLCIGGKIMFDGNDISQKFIGDIWRNSINFNAFIDRSQRFKFLGGTCIIKLNTDENGRQIPSAYRIDRTLPSFDDCGNINSCIFFISLFSDTSRQATENYTDYWLVEERKYNDAGKKVLVYKVFAKSGTADSPVLPSPYTKGIDFINLPKRIRNILMQSGIKRLNEEIPLPYYDGLGVWALRRTATNSCVPDSPLGDPLLFGCTDLLWSIDTVYSGSIVDVLLGRGKVLVPKQFLSETLERLKQTTGMTYNVTTTELDAYHDESFVYVQPSMFDKEKDTPTPVQFDIRSKDWKDIWGLYQREAVVLSGFSPSSIFPHLAPDTSAKTAREVTAEENLTCASVRHAHELDTPIYNRVIREVCAQEGLSTDISINMGDYVYNRLESNEDIRRNYEARLIPKEKAVQMINNLSLSETAEYMEKIDNDQKNMEALENSFGKAEYYGEYSDMSNFER